MDASDLQRAYAVLSLSPPVTEVRLKRRYKALVRRWHPDRYESDPAGKAEATSRLCTINLAYELVAASLEFGESQEQEVVTPIYPSERSSSSPEGVDAIVDSINRFTWPLSRGMSLHRWLSLGMVAVYLVLELVVLPVFGLPDAGSLIVAGAPYSLLPLYLIWKGDDSSLTKSQRDFLHAAGWVFMVGPAIVGLLLLITGFFGPHK
jgi:curved DNA-binding protein CbpA